LQTECAKEIKSKHIKENMQKVGMDEHRRYNSPIIRANDWISECQRIANIWIRRRDDEDNGINTN
jgi:hypothetical protein